MAELSPIKRALVEIRELKARLAAAEASRREPIAIVGMGLRFPGGVRSAEDLARLLWSGTDAIEDIPASRWSLESLYDADPDAPGKMTSRHGGFLQDIDGFDAAFFGISPREAASMDPQQRLVLEVGWEALENAGKAPDSLSGSRTGIYLGIANSDYGRALLTRRDLIDPYFITGSLLSVAAGRLSYLLGLQGPSLAVDTACSGSLVALHLACQALRSGECDMALAGGVNVILAPEVNINFSKSRVMAADGRCKTFDAAADGYVRAEGCGLVVVRRLRDALAEGDRILAVVRGSAVNQDGRSGGLTAPNGPAQEAVIRGALADAGVEPGSIGYVETHGTGTPLGDPIEVGAIGAALGAGRVEPLPIGSIKTNLGHLESAAGIAGVIKVVLALRQREIPPHLHFTTGNPHIAWAQLPLTVPTVVTPWNAIAGRRLAGVSSFGLSGTNAHVILEEAPATPAEAPAFPRGGTVVTLSAQTPEALQDLAGRMADALDRTPEPALADVGRTTTRGRAALPYRLAIAATSTAEVRNALRAPDDAVVPALFRGYAAPGARPGVAFLFPGQGPQYAGMALSLAATEPVVANALARCEAGLRAELDVPLTEVLSRADLLNETRYTQPALFSVEWALAELWRSWGIEPSAVMGHSFGEYVAACIAGVMDVEDALRLVAARGRLAEQHTRRGLMAAVFSDEATVAAMLAGRSDVLSLAAINAPDSLVVSGESVAHREFCEELTLRGIEFRPLAVSHAFHSPLIEPMLQEFARVAETVTFRPPVLPLISNVSGTPAGPEVATPEYWVRHVRASVRFANGVSALASAGYGVFLEVGPGTTVTGLAGRCLGESDIHLVPSLRSGREEGQSMREAVAKLWSVGVSVDWTRDAGACVGHPIDLPTYPFRRTRHWVEGAFGSGSAAPSERTGDWLYEIAWRDVAPGPEAVPPQTHGAWLLLGDRGGVSSALAVALEARGMRCIQASSGDALDGVLAEASLGTGIARVVYLPGLDVPPASEMTTTRLQDAQARVCGGLVSLVQSIARSSIVPGPRLSVLTRGSDETGLAASSLTGLVRVLSREHPALHCRLLDLDPAGEDPGGLIEELGRDDGETLITLRGGRRLAPRMIRLERRSEATVLIEREATYLVTGGLGGLGLRVAATLVEQGARHLVLLGRRAPSADATAALRALEAAGAKVRVAAVDVADEPALAALLDDVARTMPPLRGIIHSAGVLDDGVIAQLSWDRFAGVLAPKVMGAWNLHRLTGHLELRFFVLFSSGASLLGSPGQGSYAAANGFLDALAAFRKARGLAALSINWGPWDEVGLAAARDPQHRDRSAKQGVLPLAPRDALAVLLDLMSGAPAQVGVLNMDWKKAASQYGDQQPSLFRELLGGATTAARPRTVPIRERLGAAVNGDARGILLAHVSEAVSAVLGLPLSETGSTVPFLQLGLDSLMAVELRNRLEREVGTAVPLARFLDGSDAERITDLMLKALGLHQPGRTEEAELLDRLPGMSESEIDALLARMTQEDGPA